MQPTTETESRRGFLAALTLALGSIPILGTLFVALRAGLAPASTDAPDRIPLCRLAEVPPPGQLLERSVSFQMRRGPLVETVSRVVFVTRESAGSDPIAMLGECTHLSCPVQLRSVSQGSDAAAPLRCPCHGGAFSATGEVLDGPPPAPLRRLQLELPDSADGFIHLVEL